MSAEFDFLTPDDKPALMGLTSNDLLDNAKAALDQLGYKVHAAANHGEFLHKFAQTPYHVVVLEDVFGGGTLEENESLLAIQRMQMSQRRHCVVLLVGQGFATFNPMQAFQQGVHSVVNPSEAFLLIQLIQKAVADNDIFLHTFRHAQQRLC
jgi:DNA-binding NtrC family response regulator